ncbi:class I SAM-dependent methyltransferase [Paenibacillus thalictri]|uniref:SAM-dependent methyltransferase n=1 Tax=Paenibacillus thalictri TaxID=2527873 RepID=A0A4Q9DR81_9BACL|nr:SAM-dependent methyltransferase [Paenibacillus thalictri]TBL78131.1 SAM-dependent methyltransferase [Paenibacillus thalictri]
MAESSGQALREVIQAEIRLQPDQVISFKRYMELCLYHPKFGYYTSSRPKVGKTGDFYTSSSIGGVMGEMLAAYLAAQTSGNDTVTLVEWGGGTGALAGQLLDQLRDEFPSLYDRLKYISVETSAYHRELQRETLASHAAVTSFVLPEQWLQEGPYQGNVILSNELLDVFPVDRLVYLQGNWHHVHVGWNETEESFENRLLLLEDPVLAGYIKQEGITPLEGQWIEINLGAMEWIGQVADCLADGQIISIDYGDTNHELYASHRMNGTFLCYRGHQAYDDPYAYPGEQDMTAHVNFSACMRKGEEHGFFSSLRTQKQFLLECGILNKLQNVAGGDPFHPAARKNRAIRQLLLSDQMSELFKVLVQTKKR